METREDLDYLFHGFMSLVDICIDKLQVDLIPSRVNSDIIENIFASREPYIMVLTPIQITMNTEQVLLVSF